MTEMTTNREKKWMAAVPAVLRQILIPLKNVFMLKIQMKTKEWSVQMHHQAAGIYNTNSLSSNESRFSMLKRSRKIENATTVIKFNCMDATYGVNMYDFIVISVLFIDK